MTDFGTTFSDWMGKASGFWDAIPAEWHTILIISAVVLVGLIILDVIKSVMATGLRVVLIIVTVAVICVAFPWAGAAIMAVLNQGWSALTGLF